MLEDADLQSVVGAAKIINRENGGMAVKLFLLSSYNSVTVSWLFSRYYFTSTRVNCQITHGGV